MTKYAIIARIDVRRALHFAPELTAQVLEQVLVDATVEAWGGDPYNQVTFTVQLKRPTHQQALSEIGQILERYAFYVSEATVSEVAGDAVKAVIIETFGEGDLVLALAALARSFTERVVGAEANKIRRDYEARQDHEGNWSLTRLPQQRSSGAGAQPGLSPA